MQFPLVDKDYRKGDGNVGMADGGNMPLVTVNDVINNQVAGVERFFM
jgi:hypothetical protein